MGLYVADSAVKRVLEGENSNVGYITTDKNAIFPEASEEDYSFSYTGADQHWTAPFSGKLTIECKGAGSNNANGGYAKGTILVTKGQKFSIMVGGRGNRTDNGTTYGFGGSTTLGGRGGGGLSGVFTGDIAIGANDASRVVIIAGGAGGGRTGGGAGGGENGQNGNGGSYGGPGAGGTQTGRGSGGNTRSEQFRGGGGSGTYGFGGGGGWRGGNGSYGDSSGDDDCQAGGGSGHCSSKMTQTTLTVGGGAGANTDGSISFHLESKIIIPTPTKITSAGVYHNPELGLISMSADGENRITISDKNVGAWSNDIENELSYGGYFQFGNIHGFGVLPEPEPTPPREPGENTICYFPFLTDALDTQGNRTLTLSGCSVTDGALNVTGNTQYAQLSSAISNSEITFNMWYRPSAFNGSGRGDWNTILAKAGGTYHHLLISGGNSAEGTVGRIGVWNNSWIGSSKILTIGQWYNIVVVMNGTNYKLYVNKELVLDTTAFDNSAQPVGFIANFNTSGDQGPRGKLSRMIIESGCWSQDDINNYYEWFSQYYS